MNRWVEIRFDCLPLRTVGRLDIPLDASPEYQRRCRSINGAIQKHGAHNSYYLFNADCRFHLTNDEQQGTLHFAFEGTLLTDTADQRCVGADLDVRLMGETCPWLNEPIVAWFCETVSHSAQVEFNRYIEAGDLQKTKDRISMIQQASDEAGGFVGMYL